MSTDFRRSRLICMTQFVLDRNGLQTVKLMGHAVPGAEMAIWERGKLTPVIFYMNRGRPARIPHFDHYLIQANRKAAEAGHEQLKDNVWVRRNFRLLSCKAYRGDRSYRKVRLG
jgi:hypothetical protein